MLIIRAPAHELGSRVDWKELTSMNVLSTGSRNDSNHVAKKNRSAFFKLQMSAWAGKIESQKTVAGSAGQKDRTSQPDRTSRIRLLSPFPNSHAATRSSRLPIQAASESPPAGAAGAGVTYLARPGTSLPATTVARRAGHWTPSLRLAAGPQVGQGGRS